MLGVAKDVEPFELSIRLRLVHGCANNTTNGADYRFIHVREDEVPTEGSPEAEVENEWIDTVGHYLGTISSE